MRSRFLRRRRPSPAIVISCAALFMSLGGVGYAATFLPANSVGTTQLRNGAVTYKKIRPNAVGKVRLADGGVINSKLAHGSVSYKDIQPGAVGTVRANLGQLQARLDGACGAGSAIGTVDSKGKVTCNATQPAEYGSTNATMAVGATAANVTTVALPAGPAGYLLFANPTVTVTSGAAAQRESVTCTLDVGNTAQTRTVVVATDGKAGDTSTASIPLQLASAPGTAAVACQGKVAAGTLPATSATAQINALQTSANH